jgi:hypothetical protein
VGQPSGADTEEREAARKRADELIRGYERARHRYLVGRFGVRGAGQIERSSENLFGKLRRQGQSDSASTGLADHTKTIEPALRDFDLE